MVNFAFSWSFILLTNVNEIGGDMSCLSGFLWFYLLACSQLVGGLWGAVDDLDFQIELFLESEKSARISVRRLNELNRVVNGRMEDWKRVAEKKGISIVGLVSAPRAMSGSASFPKESLMGAAHAKVKRK